MHDIINEITTAQSADKIRLSPAEFGGQRHMRRVTLFRAAYGLARALEFGGETEASPLQVKLALSDLITFEREGLRTKGERIAG